MSRSTRGTLAVVAVLALAAALVAPAIDADAAPVHSAAVTWSDVPGATPDDLIIAPSNYLGQALDPGFSYNARPDGAADYCATRYPNNSFPCPTVDYRNYFRIDSSTTSSSTASFIITVTNPAYSQVGFVTERAGDYEQLFTGTSHGYMFYAGVLGGTQVGQSSRDEKFCQLNVPCTVSFSLTDAYGEWFGNQFVYVNLLNSTAQAMGYVFLPLHPIPPATPPTAAFSATVSGAAAHDWNFDASASTAAPGTSVASYRWTFGDGTSAVTSTATTHHTYPDGTPHTASLVVVDSAGTLSASVSQTLTEHSLIVNSNGDAPALDASRGCATGQTVGTPAEPECTLRAAIQSLDAGVGGTTITFQLPPGPKTITAASPFPDITASGATIQGSTGAGMPVITGSGLQVFGASDVTITDVSILGGSTGINFENSLGGTLTGNLIGVSPSAQVSAPQYGVGVLGGGAYTIGSNVIVGSASGLSVTATAPITSLKVVGNTVGELPSGALALTSPATGGIGLFAFTSSIAGADVENNRIAGADINLAVVGDQMIAPTIAGNTIGVAADQDTLLGRANVNLRVDGAPGAQVTGNILAGAKWDLLVSGSVQAQPVTSQGGSESIVFALPGDHPVANPITGTHVIVSGNRVGPVNRHDGANLLHGITVWNTANDTTISDNVVRDHDADEIAVSGVATGLTVSNNIVGGAPTTAVGGEDGIVVADQTDPIISTNTIGAVATGITIPATTTGAVISGNTVGLWIDGTTVNKTGIGIDVRGAGTTIGPDNTVGFSTLTGVFLQAQGARVISNRIGVAKFGSGWAPNVTGIQVASGATGAKIGGSGSGNTIAGNGTGVELDEQGAEVSSNKFGLLTSGVLGNTTAIAAYATSSIHDNTIAGSTAKGITVSPGAVVTILHNVIYGTANAAGITTRLASPLILVAPRVTHGTSTRTWLVLSDVPTDIGTIEVFGNPTCADPEGRVPLFTTPTTSSSSRVLSVADSADLAGFTVTVTTAAGTTRFSNCATAGPAADSDGDGIPDLVEVSYPTDPAAAAKPNEAAFVGDNQQWVVMTAFNGELSNVSVLDDPAPTSHPGVSFPIGLIDWTVTGLTPGDSANVGFALPGTTVNSWWKYNASHSPQFFDFTFTDAKGYGALLQHVSSDVGPSTVVSESVFDGGEGDDDGVVNGSVHDPAAPAVDAATAPSAIRPPPALASTGTASGGDLAAGLLALFVGLLLLGVRHLRRRSRPRRA